MAEAFKYIYNAMIGVSDNYIEREASRRLYKYIYTAFWKMEPTCVISVGKLTNNLDPWRNTWAQIMRSRILSIFSAKSATSSLTAGKNYQGMKT